MKSFIIFCQFSVIFLMMSMTSLLHSAEQAAIRINVGYIPLLADDKDKGILIEFLRIISKETDTPISINVLPFPRSIEEVVKGNADIHIPTIKPKHMNSTARYDFTQAVINHTNVVLYTHKDNDIALNNLSNKNLIIRTNHSMRDMFDFPVVSNFNLKGGFGMLDKQRIDGFLFPDSAGDPIIMELELKNIRRKLYQVYDVTGIVALGKRGSKADEFLQKGIEILKQKGTYLKYMSQLEYPYDNWQFK